MLTDSALALVASKVYTTCLRMVRRQAQPHDRQVHLKVTAAEEEALRVLAAEDGTNMSAVIRGFIRDETRRRARKGRR